jgi:hypothetical protein
MDTNPIHGGLTLMTLSNSNYFPKAPSPNTLTLGVRASIYEFGCGADTIQSIAVTANK